MSSFPALDDQPTNIDFDSDNIDETDFLKREQQVLGDEFKTQNDEDFVNELQESDDEVNAFNQQFPDLEDNSIHKESLLEPELEVEEVETPKQEIKPSEAIQHWKERRDLEVKERDEQDALKKQKIKEDAEKKIKLFYEEYEQNKAKTYKETQEKAEAFIEENNKFIQSADDIDSKSNVSWKKALKLLDDLDSLSVNVGDRDRSKFKNLLVKLSTKDN